jgi:hypothetical protein
MKIINCKTFDPRVKDFKNFFRENYQLIVLTVGKKAELVIIEKPAYLEKVENALAGNFKEVFNYDKNETKI